MIFNRHTIPHLLGAIWKLLCGWCGGKKTIASPKLAASRLAICEKCRFLDRGSRQCEKCTCFVDALTLLETGECPEGFWK